MKKRLIVELFILAIVVIAAIGYSQRFNCRKIVAHYYYQQAYAELDDYDLSRSTDFLIKANNWDPELNSQEFLDYHRYRDQLLADPEEKLKFFL